jgi:hypothetical protein
MKKLKYWKFEISSPIFTLLKKHNCPVCNSALIPQKIRKIVNSESIEANDFDFRDADNNLFKGDVKFIWYELYCEKCNKGYKPREIKAYEKLLRGRGKL